MKKKLLMPLIVLFDLIVVGCNSNNNPVESNNSQIQSSESPSISKSESSSVEKESTPQWWIDLFTFDNVTIMLKNNLLKKQGDEYKCIDSNWYLKAQGEDTFENHDGRNIYDIYFERYSDFNYDSENSCYKATGIALDESGYLREITINVNNGKITNITDLATLNSSSILSTLDFYDYGVTTLEEKLEAKIIDKIVCTSDTVGIYATSITLGSGISDAGEIVMMFTGEKGSPQENNIIVTIRLDYEKEDSGKYKYTTTYNDEVYQNKSGLDKIKFDLVFDNTTRPSMIVVTYSPVGEGSAQEVYRESI